MQRHRFGFTRISDGETETPRSHSRGLVINVRVNSRLVRDRKVAEYARYGRWLATENHKVRYARSEEKPSTEEFTGLLLGLLSHFSSYSVLIV